MSLTITQAYVDINGSALPGLVVTAVPTASPLFINFGGTFKETAPGMFTATTDGSGLFSLVLPYPSVCSPSTVQWVVAMPDGTQWIGTVPETAGPLTLKELEDSHGWSLFRDRPGISVATGPPGPAIAGPQGATGPTGTPVWQGAWSGGTAYVFGDAVSSGGSSYTCKLAHTNFVPPNSTYWTLLAAGGSTGATGATGANGTNGTNGTPVWKGAWSNATAYIIGDAVSDAGSAYVCKLGHTNHEPPNGTYWDVLASKGDTGATGATGPSGLVGVWLGAWSGATAYVANDVVFDATAGSSYICILGHTNHEPPNGTYWDLVAEKGDTGATGAGGLYAAYLCYQEQQTNGTNGGTFTSGSWQTRVLNTEVADTGSHGTLASNQITLDAGTYRVSASCPGFSCSDHKARLQNITDSSTLVLGQNAFCPGATSAASNAEVQGRFTIAGAKVIELQHQCALTHATNGLGDACSFGVSEIYSTLELWKES